MVDPEGYTVGESSRPRSIKVPDPGSFGLIQAIQSTLWSPLKKAFPEFIHSYTKKQFKQKLFDRIGSRHKSIALDGSSWDSCQWPRLQQTETIFLNEISDEIKQLLDYNLDSFYGARCRQVSLEDLHSRVMACFNDTINHVFIRLPGINGPDWSSEIRQRFFRTKMIHGDRPEDDHLHFAIDGTTFSGQSFRTTLGNTLRSILYVMYYLHSSGVPELKEPWTSKQIYINASGDDVVVWCEP